MRPQVLKLGVLTNLVVHVLSQTLFPNASYPDYLSLIQNQTELSALSNALNDYIEIATNYAHYRNVTVLAPNNAALTVFRASDSMFAEPDNRSTVDALFSYHVIKGLYVSAEDMTFGESFLQPSYYTNVTGGQRVGFFSQDGELHFRSGQGQNATKVLDTLYFQGGVVHVVDQVLTVPMDVTTTATFLNLTSSSGALNLTGLPIALGPAWDITVFAPNNEAFEAVGSALGSMSVSEVEDLMKYHIVSGYARSCIRSDTFSNTTYRTSEGRNITMTVTADGSTFIDNARIIRSDILLSNGILHVLDNVLNPGNSSTPSAGAVDGAIAFGGASGNGTIPFARVPLATSINTDTSFNTTVPRQGRRNQLEISGGAIAAIVLGVLVGAVALGVVTFFCIRQRGYRIQLSRRTFALTSHRSAGNHKNDVEKSSDDDLVSRELDSRQKSRTETPQEESPREELPPEGGRTEKVELPASMPISGRRRSETPSTTRSSWRVHWEKSPMYVGDWRLSKQRQPSEQSTTSQPNDEDFWTSSADEDVKRRIARLLGHQNQL